ncbi:hypothetical protein [Rhodoferax mekongensis]|uniref:Uncharacterized protein n=1 Tax=Rhodoferax mekongensis TaxID=3068341 RepID=A0ABZ0B2F1_9BURK|nr:hypothetical protein [Rhodoferax sp. TBRC 17307]WNO05996.1 hypothetical protein RAN89_06090 [Rhodoferax sp. TBRC 17307]
MTDIMKLAEAYAWHSVHGAATTGESVIGARDALQAAIEALQCENELLKRQLDAAKDVFRQDQKCILKAVADRDALQAELTKQEPVGYTDNTGIAFAVKWSGALPPNLTLYAAPKALETLRSALNAMLTQFGMDEDEFNKDTFDKARLALADTNTVEPLTEERINELALVRLVEAELKKVNV